jgi:UDP-N-acetylglucosamine diphosphorylase/glucosamine-1-phosphate N-acetyltransferase
MRICLFEDQEVTQLEPLTDTRPAYELLCGLTSLGRKQLGHFAAGESGVLIRPHLADLVQLKNPRIPVNDSAWLSAGPAILVNSRWLPPSGPAFHSIEPCVATIGSTVAYAVVEPDRLASCSADTVEDCLHDWKRSLPCRPAPGRMISYLWELVHGNAEQICQDFSRWLGARGMIPEGVALVGPRDRLLVDAGARVEPFVVIDTTGGPVVIEREAKVTAFSRLEGPCAIGSATHVLGAKIRAGTTLGPACRIGGEVEASIIQGHSNKYHDGFLGHAYVGEWVNLGAGTSTSDLRNDYGEVTVTVNGQRVPTGRNKIGCFIGDHAKTGLGTLLNTGSNIGIFANLLPSGTLLPKYIPAFASWWNGVLTDRGNLPDLLHTAATVMQRRGAAFTEAHAAFYRDLFDVTAVHRRQVLREAEQRSLRRSA